MTIPELMQAAMDQAKEKGWHDPMASFPEDLCLVHSEISEALEAYRERDFEAWHEEDGKPCLWLPNWRMP